MATRRSFTLGLDFGTGSVRAVVVDCANGHIVGQSVFDYPSGQGGVIVDARDPHLARQNPADYLAGMRASVPAALAAAAAYDAGFSRERVIGIGVDTTGSTPIPVDEQLQPLALNPKWSANPAAHAWLWKDHTGADEAAAITATAAAHAPEYLAVIGGTYSSEWFWSKIWRCLKVAPDVFAAAHTWVELADYIPAVLGGLREPHRIRRGVCAAGHKAMYSEAWGGLPSEAFLTRLDPKLAALRARLYDKAWSADMAGSYLCPEWAAAFGLPEGVPVAMGAFDAHYGAIGAGITPGTLVKIIGTSTCDIAIAPATGAAPVVPGICGTVNGSVMPDFYGVEAGQSAVGDLLRWWVEVVCEGYEQTHRALSAEAARIAPGASGLVALDWNNGNRTILVDPRLTGLIVGQTLHTTRAEIYRALIEATAFGARAIIERLNDNGVTVERVISCGGIAEKNPLFMQIYADVLGYPMLIAGSTQTPALGSAVVAAVIAGGAAGGYDDFATAQAQMTRVADTRYLPDPAAKKTYDALYGIYRELHDSFGAVPGASANFPTLMKRLLAIRERAQGDHA
jgi:L-ribulokinase